MELLKLAAFLIKFALVVLGAVFLVFAVFVLYVVIREIIKRVMEDRSVEKDNDRTDSR